MSNHFFLSLAVCFYVFYIFGILYSMFLKRKKAVVSKEIDYKFFKAYKRAEALPDHLIIAGRHADNQFQVPPIFMITVVLLLTFPVVSTLTVIFAWIFVFSRMLHTYIHLGSNKPLRRAQAYMLGWLAIFAMWVQIMMHFATY